MTLPETMLWQRLRGSQIGVKVRRQHPVGPYIADLYIREGRMVIEVDGEAHNLGDRPLRDVVRDDFMSRNGYSVLRLAAREILKDVNAVVDGIAAQVGSPLHHPSDGSPPRSGEEL